MTALWLELLIASRHDKEKQHDQEENAVKFHFFDLFLDWVERLVLHHLLKLSGSVRYCQISVLICDDLRANYGGQVAFFH